MRPWVLVLVIGLGGLAGSAMLSGQDPVGEDRPSGERVEAAGLHNVFRITDRLYSGSSPDGDEGFRSLQKLGVRTVISVDGARPEVARAKKYGLRYVHLPIGYDGVPREQALRIARAVRNLPGPIYLHCHHGQHRGPAAAAVAHLFLDERCPVGTALAEMRRAGTDPRYAGLYAAPKTLRRPTPQELDQVPADFPEAAPVPALARLMVQVDERWDNLKRARAAGWKTPPDHPDVDPPHEAVQLAEHFREAARLPDTARRPEDFRRALGEAEALAGDLEAGLRRVKGGGPVKELGAVFQRAGAACSRCHAKHRDTPR